MLVSGSLLTLPAPVATTSWSRWSELQPQTRVLQEGFDLGPSFLVEPFRGVRALRAVVMSGDWELTVTQFEEGVIEMPPALRCDVHVNNWTSTAFIAQAGTAEAHGSWPA